MSKIIGISAFVFSCFSFVSCSTELLKQDNSSQVIQSKISIPLDAGPSLKVTNYFLDVSDKMGLGQIESVANYPVDFDSDGYIDLVLLTDNFSNPQFFKFNPSVNRFQKIEYLPFGKKIHATFLSFADFDRDGILDVLVANPSNKTELSQQLLTIYKGEIINERVSYKQMSKSELSGVVSPTSVTLLDYDLDGHLDIFVSNWYDKGKESSTFSPDKLFKGNIFSFSDVSGILNGEYEYSKLEKKYVHATPTYSASLCDFDQNGFPDIVTSATSGYPNKLWINSGIGAVEQSFTDMAEKSGYDMDDIGRLKPKGGGHTMFSLCADYNNDRIFDLVVGEFFHSYDNEDVDRSALLTGSQRSFPFKFIRSEYYLDDGTLSWSQRDTRGNWIDLNGDGLIDLLIDNSGFPPKSREVVFIQEDDHAFSDQAKKLGLDIVNPSGTVVVDYNYDAKPDVLMGQTSLRNSSIVKKLYLMENKISAGNHLAIKLVGQKANTSAIGALAKLVTNAGEKLQYLQLSNGHFPSQNSGILYFGLGAEKIKSLEVTWPYFDQEKKHILRTKYNLTKFASEKFLTICEGGKVLKGFNTKCTK